MACMHRHIEARDERDDNLHYEGWRCLDCGAVIYGPCHLQFECRSSFCGADPALAEEHTVRPAATA